MIEGNESGERGLAVYLVQTGLRSFYNLGLGVAHSPAVLARPRAVNGFSARPHFVLTG